MGRCRRGRGDAASPQAPAEPIESDADPEIGVRVDAKGDSNIAVLNIVAV